MSSYFSNEENINDIKLTDYQKILKQLDKLKLELEPDQNKVNKIFKDALDLIKKDSANVNKKYGLHTLIKHAAFFGDINTITYLLKNHLHALIKKNPGEIKWAIFYAALKNRDNALELLLTRDILEKIMYKNSKVLDSIKNDLSEQQEKSYIKLEVKKLISKALPIIDVIQEYPVVLKKLAQLINKNPTRKKEIKEQFAKAIKLVNNNVNYTHSITVNKGKDKLDYSLIELAAMMNNDETIEYLLKNCLDTIIKEKPITLSLAIGAAAFKGNEKVLNLLLINEKVLNKVINDKPVTLSEAIWDAAKNGHKISLDLLLSNDKIIEALIKHYKAKNLTEVFTKEFGNYHKTIIDKIVKTREEIVVARKSKSSLVVAGAGNRRNTSWAWLAATVLLAIIVGVEGVFVGMLLASKSNKVKNCSLVINHLMPAFNKLNNQLTKISSKFDLDKLAKILVNPKIVGLIVGMTAILGVIALALDIKLYKQQGGVVGKS